ncbi:hypothetical protein SCUCBS95973_000480 [Sporothrix curviconia]|uniref:Uncharacterized protein n=1 Tax=Sporothrix curviconia TaxID=1260050 RepID=A0ABP0AQU8_9PEZI
MEDEPSEPTVNDTSTPAVNGSNGSNGRSETVVVISPKGDVVLDVLFETSREALLETARALRKKPSNAAASAPARPPLKPKLLMAFRVETEALVKHSRYFANLLGDTRFQEAQTVKAGLAALALDGIKPADADISRLPRVHIDDDDEGSRTAGRELVFAELLRILHWDGSVAPVATSTDGDEAPGVVESKRPPPNATVATKTKPPKAQQTAKPNTATAAASWREKKAAAVKEAKPAPAPTQPRMPGSRWSARTPPTLLELATLALQADRFACMVAVAAYVRALRLRFPQPIVRATRGDGTPVTGPNVAGGSSFPGLVNEEGIRQKVFVSWLLDQPIRFHAGTRELILFGSQRWKDALEGGDNEFELDGEVGANGTAHVPRLPAWWDLPDGIEGEMQFRRACIVNCIASVPRHFLALYTSRNKRQCKMGYESSAACDSFQLGEIVKFLFHKDLVFLHDFSSTVMVRGRGQRRISPADYAAVDINHILAMLKQCPAYQLDKHHVNCGLRTRILPILEYIQAMLGASAVGLHRHEWTAVHHGKASWLASAEAAGLLDGDSHGYDYGDESDDGDATDAPSFGKPPPRSGAAETDDPHAPQVFRFTRSLAGDPRLRMESSMAADRMAQQLFSARRWNWTPET